MAKNIPSVVTVELFDGYFIEIDDLNHTLKQAYIGKSKDGADKEYKKIIGYFNNIKVAIDCFARLATLDECDGKVITLKEYVETVEMVFEKIKKLEIVRKG